ncbi:alcohol dehydrogenase catalytic domain-containing protein [Actinomadura sp. ATCC 31491]|uniref:Alcohol dehydrogenase catalytic domain-containing protein n=1 Tax=Actinomadura luzonensis TaxID=2805427 RepID=A0ABT0G227_9ACTN|nr:alcohol dehydrogenase catalytic domain-containing protein [Actinomadura luzonensis]MCK2218661.1 alcohol dehydrogenase catalytic domain-containing protein [Actinomadura luzonensis]
MRGAVLYAPGDVRVDERRDPSIEEPADAVIRLAATCICGSDLWPYRGLDEVAGPAPMGHEYVGVVEEVGGEVTTVEPGQFVVGSFFASDNTCEICRAGYQSGCVRRVPMNPIGTQAQFARIPLADGTLVVTPGTPDADLVPGLLAASDVLGTGWFGAVAADAGPGRTVAVRPGGHVGYVGVAHGVELPGEELFFSLVHLHGGPAPVRRFLPELIRLICEREIDPGPVFDLTLPLEEAAEGYRAMDERRAVKVLLTP